MYASKATMNMNAKGKSNLSMLQQRQRQAPLDQDNHPKGKGVRLERAQMSAQFSKTEMCKFNVLGICNKGAGCVFAHSETELKSRPDLSCTRLCRVFLQTGQCNDANCSFAHSKDQLRTTDFFHKTKLCKFWQAGHCILDDKCRFAHTTNELKSDVMVKQTPQQHNLNGNNPMPLPEMLNQIQLLLQQREQLQQQLMSQSMQALPQQQDYREQSPMGSLQIYSGCATPEYHDFDTAPYLCPATLQEKLELASSTCDSQEADRFQGSFGTNSDSNSFDLGSPEPETDTCEPCEDQWEPSGSDSYGSRTPDFPPMYGEGQMPIKMMPPMQFRLPQLVVPVQMIGNGRGDAMEHYAGDMEIVQAPLPDEAPLNGNWQCNSSYQVKNTFISEESTMSKPLRYVRSAAGRLSEMQNMM
eukprot:gnl/MRDRNA2_/MRDRNA2_73077_c0_seq1.p1 gnl/MRDRNA2_/MRDRNA2_73077_c0~~gnl/MRDRNA2_/MRDRNA2_73077_c0_seq1.p1  ORF type:complete len:413 (-),score=69.28 gnl/MRDRNA2_/MRDRNA2_73077_c0_seq1:3-1241(-)